jgi:hypothetical protein
LLDSIDSFRETEITVETIVIFNNSDLGNRYRNHPKIHRSAVMSCNIGVSRAWAVGIAMARTEFSCICNADVLLKDRILDELVTPFLSDHHVAMTGPVGFKSSEAGDLRIDHKTACTPTVVTAIAGFLFCVRSKDYQTGQFYFDHALTPAFSEEEDLANQYARKNAKMIAVPTDLYEHGGSGSHLHRSEIKYFEQSIDKSMLLARNINYVRTKWKN